MFVQNGLVNLSSVYAQYKHVAFWAQQAILYEDAWKSVNKEFLYGRLKDSNVTEEMLPNIALNFAFNPDNFVLDIKNSTTRLTQITDKAFNRFLKSLMSVTLLGPDNQSISVQTMILERSRRSWHPETPEADRFVYLNGTTFTVSVDRLIEGSQAAKSLMGYWARNWRKSITKELEEIITLAETAAGLRRYEGWSCAIPTRLTPSWATILRDHDAPMHQFSHTVDVSCIKNYQTGVYSEEGAKSKKDSTNKLNRDETSSQDATPLVRAVAEALTRLRPNGTLGIKHEILARDVGAALNQVVSIRTVRRALAFRKKKDQAA